MKQFLKWTGGTLLVASMPLMAADPPAATPATPAAPAAPALPNGGVDVSLQLSSNYVFRGADMYQNKFVQDRQSYGKWNKAPSFQPSITFKTPVDGLTFNIWGAFALTNRNDKDVDQRIQNGKGGVTSNDTILANPLIDSIDYNSSATPPNTVGTSPAQYLRNYFNTATTFYPTGNYAGASTVNVPGFYKDANGLGRVDELDYTIAYSSATKVGTIGFGLVTYQLANAKGKGNPFIAGGSAFYYATEMFATYALPMLPDLTAKAYADIVNSNQYYQLVYSKTIAVSDAVSVTVTTGPSYSIQSALYAVPNGSGNTYAGTTQTLQGWKDVTSSVGVSAKGFNVQLNAAYRPDLRFYDSDPSTNRLVEIDGGSTMNDGRVADPKWTGSGVAADVVQRGITAQGRRLAAGNGNYQFVARQKLPRWIYWVNAGYTASF